MATSSGKESVIAKTSKHQQLFKLFHHIVMASSDSEIKHGKPAPDVFLVCAKRFPDNPNPEKVIIVLNQLSNENNDILLSFIFFIFWTAYFVVVRKSISLKT